MANRQILFSEPIHALMCLCKPCGYNSQGLEIKLDGETITTNLLQFGPRLCFLRSQLCQERLLLLKKHQICSFNNKLSNGNNRYCCKLLPCYTLVQLGL